MDKILSQDEINALFSAMATEDVGLRAEPEKPDADQRKVSRYDFHRADRISQDQMRSLTLLHDDFARNFSSSLSAYLRAFVEVSLASVEQRAYGEFLKVLPDPTLFSSIGLRPLDGNMALELNPNLVFPMIDMLLGGPGNVLAEARNLTEIEMHIIEGVINLAMRDLKEAWRPIMEMDFYLEGAGAKPQMFQIVSGGETVVTIGLDIRVGENAGTMNICIPSRILKVIRSRFDHQWNIRRQKVAGSETDKLLNLIRTAGISVSGVLKESNLTVHDLLQITPGDVIQLNKPMGDPVLLCVAGIPKFVGHVVMRHGKRAFEITDRYAL
jgi:flagellar motor switch protein FliM